MPNAGKKDEINYFVNYFFNMLIINLRINLRIIFDNLRSLRSKASPAKLDAERREAKNQIRLLEKAL